MDLESENTQWSLLCVARAVIPPPPPSPTPTALFLSHIKPLPPSLFVSCSSVDLIIAHCVFDPSLFSRPALNASLLIVLTCFAGVVLRSRCCWDDRAVTACVQVCLCRTRSRDMAAAKKSEFTLLYSVLVGITVAFTNLNVLVNVLAFGKQKKPFETERTNRTYYSGWRWQRPTHDQTVCVPGSSGLCLSWIIQSCCPQARKMVAQMD